MQKDEFFGICSIWSCIPWFEFRSFLENNVGNEIRVLLGGKILLSPAVVSLQLCPDTVPHKVVLVRKSSQGSC